MQIYRLGSRVYRRHGCGLQTGRPVAYKRGPEAIYDCIGTYMADVSGGPCKYTAPDSEGETRAAKSASNVFLIAVQLRERRPSSIWTSLELRAKSLFEHAERAFVTLYSASLSYAALIIRAKAFGLTSNIVTNNSNRR